MSDVVFLNITTKDERGRDPETLMQALARLAASPLAAPAAIKLLDRRQEKIEGFDAPAVAAAIRAREPEVRLEGEGIEYHFGQAPDRANLAVYTVTAGLDGGALRALFVDLCVLLHAWYGVCHDEVHGEELARLYRAEPRTFFADGLYWLNFFGPEEERLQGGPALADNPHAEVERLPEGLVVQAGADFHQAATPNGERRLVAATRALPPLPAAAPRPGDRPVDLTEVDGVRGFFDPDDDSFWVSKHVQPDHRLPPREIERLASLVGRWSPAVVRVVVLFSLRESAEANREDLQAAGIGVWFIDGDTGRPRELA